MRSSTRAPARTTRLEAARRRREKRGFDQPTAREAGSGVNGCIFLGIHCYTLGAHRMHVSTREEHSLRALPPLSAILTVVGPTGACTSGRRHKIYIGTMPPAAKSQRKFQVFLCALWVVRRTSIQKHRRGAGSRQPGNWSPGHTNT